MSHDDQHLQEELLELSRSKDRAAALSDAAFEAVFISDKGVCIDTNGAASEMFGYRYDELIGIFGTDVIAEESKELVKQNIMSGYEDAYEAVCQRKDGSKFVGELRGKMFEYMGKPCRATVVRDISLYKEAQAQLELSEARYDLAIKGATDGIWDWDRETDRVYFSPRWKEIIGYEDHEIPNDLEEWKKRIHPDDVQHVLEINDVFFNDPSAETFSVEYRLQHKDGSYVWILGRGACMRDENGLPFRMAGAHTDITEQKQNQAELERSERKWRGILVKASQIGVQLDASGKIIFVNAHFCDVTGWKEQEALGKDWATTFVPPEEYDNCLTSLQSLFDGDPDNDFSRHEGKLLCKNGEVRLISWSSVVSLDGNGRFIDLTCLGIDLTERERANKALQRAKEYAESANEAKSVFLATMSHEIRTPLNGIMGMLQLARTTHLDSEGEEYISTALSSSRDLLRILSDVLDLSRIEAGLLEISETDFQTSLAVVPVVQSLEELARNKGLTISSEVLPGVPEMVRGDIGRIRQILVNLVNNAIKYTTSGRVDVTLQARENPGPDLVTLIFTVRDTGHGIPKDQLDSIWEPFSQVSTEQYSCDIGGIGLGLSIVRKLVDSLGGTVHMESVVGAGTTVEVSMPLPVVDVDSIGSPEASEDTDASEVSTTRRVLLVEDDALNQLALKNMLLKIGVDVTLAVNGQEALDKVLNQQFDLVFMDVQMPVMNGIEATKAIIRQTDPRKRPPIIAMTAYAMRGDRESFLAVGMEDYMAKPIEFDDLMAMVKKHLG